MKSHFGRHISSIFLGALVLGIMAPCALRAQSAQNPNSSTNSPNSTNSQTTTKKSKKSKSSTTDTSGGTSGSASTSGSSSTSATGSSGAAAPSITQGAPSASTKGTPATHTGAAQQPPSPGMVWVNTSTKVYHAQGSKYYGNTKQGKWMTEGDAVKAGYKKASN